MKKETTLNIEGKYFKAFIEYKRTTYIKYKVEDGNLIISCPYFTSDKFLESIIKLKKIEKRIKEYEKPLTDEYCYIFGDKIYIEGSFLRFMNKKILYNKDTFYDDIKKDTLPYFIERVRYFEKIMSIDEPYKISLKLTKSRYGSNSRKTHHLSFNIYLIHFDKEIIDAIIVHELSHHFYFDHSANFYKKIYEYIPNYELLHKCLNNCQYKGLKND